ncbi:arylesterase [Plastorhodobacter daqingensis]|uniref:Arylesterase n=1 Tax=Plastorhodobacter daqingensis TaxID=1387281 RepID=A0ABW2UM34_9RHOB
MKYLRATLIKAFAKPYGAAAQLRNRCIAASVAAILALAPGFATATTLLALGDSLTQGYGLPPEDGLVPQLERWLQDQGRDVTVINAGVSGDTTAGGRARVAWALADAPDAMIVALGGNDLLRGIDPATSRANLEAILQAAADRAVPVLLVGLPAPGNYGPEFRRAFDAMYPELAAEFGALHAPNIFQPMMDKADAGESFADLMQGDHIHPNARGVELIVEALGPRVLELLDRAEGTAPAE